MNDPDFQKILAEKRAYYGNIEAAIEFAAEEYARQMVEQYKQWLISNYKITSAVGK